MKTSFDCEKYFLSIDWCKKVRLAKNFAISKKYKKLSN